MKIKKSLLAASAVAALGIGSLVGLQVTQAASPAGSTNLIDRLVAKFNLNKDEVQAVFDEERAAHMAEHEQAMQDRLVQAVTDGKLTQAQADQILAKQKEFQEYHASQESKPEDEERAALKTKMDELTKWATDNNIPQEYLLMGPGGMRGGHHGPGKHMRMPAAAPTEAAN